MLEFITLHLNKLGKEQSKSNVGTKEIIIQTINKHNEMKKRQ